MAASRLPSAVAGIHRAQQAALRRREEARPSQQNRARRRERAATTPTPQPTPPMPEGAAKRGPPPPDFPPDETALERQQRTRPIADAPNMYDADFRLCPACLDPFVLGADVWRPHQLYHKYCWDNVVRAHVSNQRRDAPIEPPCAVCRGPGLAVSSGKYAGHQGAEDLPNTRAAVEETNALRAYDQTLIRLRGIWSFNSRQPQRQHRDHRAPRAATCHLGQCQGAMRICDR